MGLQDFHEFYKLRDRPVYMAVVRKSGCTYIKNLFYYLNTGELHPLGDQIHKDEKSLLRASEEDVEDILNSPYVSIVLRNPVNRFLSLYYDKIYNPYDKSIFWFREEIGLELGMNFDPDLDIEGHKKNTLILIDWIGKNIEGETEFFKDFHWRPQYWMYRRIKPFNPDIIPLELLGEALPMKIGEVVPDIREAMEAVRAKNKSPKPFSYDDIRSWPVTKRVRAVYAQDYALHKQGMRRWKSRIQAAEGAAEPSAVEK